jgi:hypothetical protein
MVNLQLICALLLVSALAGDDMKIHGDLEVTGELNCESVTADDVTCGEATLDTLTADTVNAESVYADTIHLDTIAPESGQKVVIEGDVVIQGETE